jgi:prolyl-tRNA synthetase
MLQSKLFTKTSKQLPKDEPSLNAQLLLRAGYVDKLMAGVYSYLPLGLRVLNKIKNIIREEMDKIDGQEILMPALTPKEIWLQTGRWEGFDALFKLVGKEEREYALGATHEEVVTPLVQRFVTSYKDLPCAVYQIQDKFRNEARAKSGLMRGREFSMKDLYSFNKDEADLDEYYEKAKKAYFAVFARCGLDTLLVEASGGVFSKFSHEYQVLTKSGEDEVFVCYKCERHQNKELVEGKEELKCPYCGSKREIKTAIEVGNIFKLKTRFTDSFGFDYTDEKGEKKRVQMGCYGIGPSRVMGAIAEIHHDENGIIWPKGLAPFDIHLLLVGNDDSAARQAEEWYARLSAHGFDVLFDDRTDVTAGAKFADADLIGIPYRVVISPKTRAQDSAEVKMRSEKEARLVPFKELLEVFK